MAGHSNTDKKNVAVPSVTRSPQHSEARRIVRVFFGRRLAVIGLALVAMLIIVAIFAPLSVRKYKQIQGHR